MKESRVQFLKDLEEADRILGKAAEIVLSGVSFKFHPVQINNFKDFVDCAGCLAFDRLYDLFMIEVPDFNGPEKFDKMLSIVLRDDPQKLKTVMLASDWPLLRKTIGLQNDVGLEEKEKKVRAGERTQVE
jgi:hypothetical protein